MPEDTLILGHNYYESGYEHLHEHLKYMFKKFVFSFVRNPYDRAVSAFFYLSAGGNNVLDKADHEKYNIAQYENNFEKFVCTAFPEILTQIHFMPQYTWIYYNDVNLCNYICKMENIGEEITKLSKIITLKSTNLPHKNESIHDSFETYYTQKTREIIYKYYEKDFKLFNYNYLPLK